MQPRKLLKGLVHSLLLVAAGQPEGREGGKGLVNAQSQLTHRLPLQAVL